MKTIVLYSSRTGNTRKVAEAIASALPAGTPCLDLTQPLPEDLDAYDCVFLGYWVETKAPLMRHPRKSFLGSTTPM